MRTMYVGWLPANCPHVISIGKQVCEAHESYVDVDSGCPSWVDKAGRGRLGKVVVDEAANVAHSTEQNRAGRGRDKPEDGGLLNAVGKRLDGDVVHGVPLEQVAAAVDRGAGAVELKGKGYVSQCACLQASETQTQWLESKGSIERPSIIQPICLMSALVVVVPTPSHGASASPLLHYKHCCQKALSKRTYCRSCTG